MALRMIYVATALALLIVTGCKTSAHYQPCCPAPAVVATAPVQPPCPPGQLPPPPPLR